MIRRSSRFAAQRNEDSESEIANPLEALANLTDVWVVLAVALMMGLIANWNLDIASAANNASSFDESKLSPIESIEDVTSLQESAQNQSYEDIGRAYRASDGTVYILPESTDGTE